MAINITRVYTRGGDKGMTSLVGGVRIEKDSRKLDSYGSVDELNCLVGIARAAIEADPRLGGPVREDLDAQLRLIQNKLFDVGSILATPAGRPYPGMPEIEDGDSTALERWMDAMQESLEPLKSFCLPGGTAANAALHHCRAVCRRCERDILRLARDEAVDMRLVKYVNRLSDYFFVMSRYAARKAGVPEYLWEFGLSSRKPGGKAAGSIDKAPAPAAGSAPESPGAPAPGKVPGRTAKGNRKAKSAPSPRKT